MKGIQRRNSFQTLKPNVSHVNEHKYLYQSQQTLILKTELTTLTLENRKWKRKICTKITTGERLERSWTLLTRNKKTQKSSFDGKKKRYNKTRNPSVQLPQQPEQIING